VPALNSATDELIMDYSSLATSQLLAILDVTRRLAELRLVQPLMEYVAVTVFEITPAERCLIVLFAEDGTPQVQITKKLSKNCIVIRPGNCCTCERRTIDKEGASHEQASTTKAISNRYQ
jgi:selenocysteine lyase/cysteine desulfurase